MSQFNFDVITEKSHYQRNENIKGTVHLELLEPLKVQSVILEFMKCFECELRADPFVHNNHRVDNCIYSHKIVLYKKKKVFNELGSGHHVFPFIIKPKQSDNGSSQYSDFLQDTFLKFKNFYNIAATLNMEEGVSCTYTKTKEVVICSQTDIVKKKTEKISIMSCICLTYTNILLIAYTNEAKYAQSEEIKFITRLSVDTYRIKRIKSRLVCTFWINYRNMKYRDNKIICSTEKSIVESGECRSSLYIPANAPSSTYERHLIVSYTLESLIFINRGSPIRISREIAIGPKKHQNMKYAAIGAIRGIHFPTANLFLV